jgi:hypothetical protein
VHNILQFGVLLDVIKNLTPEQESIVRSIGFGSILGLACSTYPNDVFNWLATHMNSTTGSINLPNGFSFNVNRECVHIIMGFPLGSRTIPCNSTPEIIQQVNMEIHGKAFNPSIYELAVV